MPDASCPNREKLAAVARWVVERSGAGLDAAASMVTLFDALMASLPGWPCPVLFARLWQECSLEVLLIPPERQLPKEGKFTSFAGELPADALLNLGIALRAEIIAREAELMCYASPCGTEIIVFVPEVRETVLRARAITLLAEA